MWRFLFEVASNVATGVTAALIASVEDRHQAKIDVAPATRASIQAKLLQVNAALSILITTYLDRC